MSKTPLALLILFFFSGACSLVYQVVWVRMLMPVFGVSTFAVSIVLAAFMAGLALGSYWCGRVADRRGNGLRLYWNCWSRDAGHCFWRRHHPIHSRIAPAGAAR